MLIEAMPLFAGIGFVVFFAALGYGVATVGLGIHAWAINQMNKREDTTNE